ncbi:MAG: hypothetical protein HWQ38_07830 [Nostoc sp. NMS7]|uniref:hypothetical protein n=1 Tax=Nostoc sp. NMS7 TaxID=2815391 RepID=UPI0025E6DE8C|nr:hypothetical protein [Nostoc sp. NMS7]MBN3946391.1 hypothetical protein [Nostoc sp. NMS7]
MSQRKLLSKIKFNPFYIALIVIALFNSSVRAELPEPKNLVYIGILQPKTTSETKNYVEISSIQKRGKQKFFTRWAFWKYLQDTTYTTKILSSANCVDWEVTEIHFAAIDQKGNPTFQWSEKRTTLGTPGSLEDKTLQVVCKN